MTDTTNLRRGAAALLAVALLMGAACTDDGSSSEAEEADKRKPDPECLAHAEIPPGADATQPAIAIKVENDPAARPQSGLEDADVVFEEVVEGGITRFMAIYHCSSSEVVGPIRSARFDDPKILLPFTNVLAFSGSNAIVGKELHKREVRTLVEGMKGDAFFRKPPNSSSVHSVFADTEKLREFAPKKSDPPKPGIFPIGDLPPGAKKAKRATITFGNESTIQYRWEGDAWYRYEGGEKFMAKGGGQIGVPNLLIQEVRVDNSKRIVDIEGNPSPELKLVGTGRAILFRDGRAIPGEWRIREEFGVPQYTTKSGDPFAFADGPVWVELVPSRAGQVKGSIDWE